ncbi:hypothetical protein D9611_011879 [Ephemerocybe angulata]|uniref:Uncharacterized protein n=1 Tax=Ephemerocybe angulata TaxID=980116 RepID=A0A8H5BXY5_9AGAR|nr:hypothetical protein D9611_011879 [Tulosesus angulatus]
MFIRVLPFVLLATQILSAAAAPLAARHDGNHGSNIQKPAASSASATKSASASASATATGMAGATATATAKAGDITGTFATAIPLLGGDQKTDVLFTKGTVGSLELEFQDKNTNTLTVTENKAPAKNSVPAGFAFLDPVTYKIALEKSAAGLTLQKVDFIFDPASTALKGVDFAKAKVGKLCTETKAFVISDAVGEQEFEDDENEVTLTASDINGEWGIFIPTASAAATPAAGGNTEEETNVTGTFNKAIATPAGSKKTDILFTASAAGSLEVEIKSAAANTITVKKNTKPVAPPTGFVFVDPTSFQIATASATAATDLVKVDYIFTDAVAKAVDITKGVIGKLDAAKNEWVTDPAALKAEFEVEADENEWTLTVPDLNGEWAVFIPTTAVKSPQVNLLL